MRTQRPERRRSGEKLEAEISMIGQSISHYRILRRLGAGGMGEVFEAEDTDLHRKVAVKILPQNLAAKPENLDRFKREARALAALNHPNIVTIFSVEQADTTHFLTMELVEGRPLSDLIPKGGFDVEKLFALAVPLADALAAAHARGIGHRDLKPSNVMVNDQGRVKVIDFGLAKLFQPETGAVDADASTVHQTVEGQILGTPAYMSPEQIEGRKVDHRTDIFSLGVLLCEMATAQQPFKGDTTIALMSSILRDAPQPLGELKPGLPEHLGQIVGRCLRKNPDERYQSALEVRNDLKGLEEDTKLAQRPGWTAPIDSPQALKDRLTPERIDPLAAPGLPGSSRSSQESRRWSLGLMAVLLFALAGTALYWFKFRQGANTVSQPSDTRRIESVAVLPFKNFITDTNKLFFADMLTEEIIGKLGGMSASKNSTLQRVISAPTMLKYKGTTLSTRAIAKELNVDSLVAGSLGLSGTQVSISVQLIEAARDRSIWSTNYVGEVNHLIQLQNQMALGISRAIHLVLTSEEQSRLTSARQVDPGALESYTRGKHRGGTKEDNLQAIKLFEEAVRIDPDFAAGHAALATAYVNRYYFWDPQQHKQWEEKAVLELDKALTLDPGSADAHLTLGSILWSPFKNFQHEEAIKEFQIAARLNPNSFDAHRSIAILYGHTGLLDEALIHARRAAELNRLANVPLISQAMNFLFRGEFENSMRYWRKVPRSHLPSYVGSHTAWAQFGLRQTNAAAATIESFLKESPEDSSGELTAMNALLRAAAGDIAGAKKNIQSAIAKDTGYGEFHHTCYLIAAAYAIMNMREDALSWLEKTADTGFPNYSLFENDPNLKNLHGTPGFVAFLSTQKKQWQERKDIWLKTDDLVKASAAR